MMTAGNEAIEQKCMAVALWMTRRACLYTKGQTEKGDKADLMVKKLIQELMEKMGK